MQEFQLSDLRYPKNTLKYKRKREKMFFKICKNKSNSILNLKVKVYIFMNCIKTNAT